MMSFLACDAGRPTTSCRCSSRTCTSTAPTPARSRGATRSPTTCRADAHVVVIGCGEAGLLAGIRLAQAGLPFTIVEKNGGPGGTWWENRYPGARVDIGSHFYCYSFEPADHWTEYFSQQPELREYFERVMTQARRRASTAGSTPRSTAATFDEATGRWAVEVRNPDGATETLDARAVISAVGALNQPAAARHPGHGRLRRAVVPLRPLGPRPSTTAARASRSIGAGASGFQIAPTIADEVEQLTVFQRTAQWMFPNANYHRARARRRALGDAPPAVLRPVVPLPHLLPGRRAHRSSAHRIDPDYDDSDGLADQRDEPRRPRELFAELDRARSSATTPTSLARVDARLPADRQADAAGQRLVARVPAQGQRRARAHRHRAHRRRRRRHRRRHASTRPTSSATRPASGTTTSSGRCTSSGAAARSLREQWGDEPTAYLGITVPELPEPVLPVRPGHEPRARRAA